MSPALNTMYPYQEQHVADIEISTGLRLMETLRYAIYEGAGV